MKKTSVCINTAIITLALCICASAQSNDIRWQDISKELDGFPFSRAFTDSVTNLHLGDAAQRQAAMRKVKPGSFINGETLVYEAGWGPFMAGYFILEARHIRGRGLIRISAKAMTSNVISAFHIMREHTISWIDDEGMYPRFFEQHVREGRDGRKFRLDAYVINDNANDKLYYQRRRMRTFDTPKFTHDYLSIMYYARSMPLNPGDTFAVDMFTSPKTTPVTMSVRQKKETVQTPAGTFNCVVVDPTFLGDTKAFNRKSKIEIWVTDDDRKIPVLIKAKAKFGSVQARLIHVGQ